MWWKINQKNSTQNWLGIKQTYKQKLLIYYKDFISYKRHRIRDKKRYSFYRFELSLWLAKNIENNTERRIEILKKWKKLMNNSSCGKTTANRRLNFDSVEKSDTHRTLKRHSKKVSGGKVAENERLFFTHLKEYNVFNLLYLLMLDLVQ